MSGAGSSPAGSSPAGVATPAQGTGSSGRSLIDPNTELRTGTRRISLTTGDYELDGDVLAGMPPVAQKVLIAGRLAARRLREIPRITEGAPSRVRAIVDEEFRPLTSTGQVLIVSVETFRAARNPSRLAIRLRWRDLTTNIEQETDLG